MKPIDVEEIRDLTTWEKQRERERERIIELKDARRVSVGDRLSFLFENRDTVLYQIQEMCRTERIVDPERIRFEIETYADLLPPPHGLSATLMIEIPERSRIRSELDRLIGIDEHVYLDVGDASVRASFDPKQFEQDRISAVQYVRFELGRELAARFADPAVPARLRVEHPSYRASAPLDGKTRRSLIGDLEGS